MTTYVSQSIEGVNVSMIYNAYDQTLVSSSTNSPDYPGAPFVSGTEVVCTDGSIWQFTKVAASATLAFGNVCGIDQSVFTCTPVIGGATYEATKKRVAFYQNTTSATAGQFCWVMVSGQPTITVSGAPVKGVQLFTTDTSGTLDDAVATGSQYPVRNVFVTTTVSGATATTQTALASWPAFGPIASLT